MLPKHSRLTKQMIEDNLIRARRLKTSRFLVLYTVIPQFDRPKISITVSKKVAPKAVLRNKLRRRSYSAVKPLIEGLSPGTAILVSYILPDTKVSIADITLELKNAFQKAGLYK